MPQLNPEFYISQLFWLAVFFSFLFIFLWKVSLPRIANVLEKRQNKINENLSTAKELQAQAQKIEKNINTQINNAKQETDDEIKKTILSLQEDVSLQLSSIDSELEKKISESELEIIKNRDDQLNKINDEIANITKLALSKVSDLNLSDNDIKDAIKSKGALN
ncbi:MAG: hypothetical protein CMG00_00795 [Candidatus Marinimicrobia bacterium]|nr:hypothetical protein [Candidatus Neomarinimicrobiota bacterium]|tara:strand:- start:16215 stop:16703 length:489 start_codon:yes stop_codon:yes gene_type:complete